MDGDADDGVVRGVGEYLPEEVIVHNLGEVAQANKLWSVDEVPIGQGENERSNHRPRGKYQKANEPGSKEDIGVDVLAQPLTCPTGALYRMPPGSLAANGHSVCSFVPVRQGLADLG